MRKAMKSMLEFWNPVKQFCRMRTISEQVLMMLISLLSGILCYLVGNSVKIYAAVDIYDFMKDVLGDFITVLALFVSFTVGYLSILITSSSENVNALKQDESKEFFDENGRPYTLYQILMTEITYTVLVEISVLLVCVIEKFLINCFMSQVLKIFCSINVSLFVYVLLLILVDVKNLYFSFWKSK